MSGDICDGSRPKPWGRAGPEPMIDGEVVHQRVEVGTVLAVVVETGVDDVEPPLGHPPQVRHDRLSLLALGPHGPDVLEGAVAQPVEVVRCEQALELRFQPGHHGERTRRAALSSPGRDPQAPARARSQTPEPGQATGPARHDGA